MANSHQNTNSKYTSSTGHTNGCAQQNSVLMANVWERSPGEEVWDDSWHGIQTVIWWHPDGNLVALALNCNRAKIFDIAEGEIMQCIRRRRMMLHFTQVEISW
ncbi:PREDICTED: uncharacterized protein LOC108369716 [Rhagoletis zephyria]|uniref:uncharacterized protein LOC108369716 n=1 Tax=Rhagoletis zephyria TaxID=28612 RepID=UPI0008114E75|nr:PREDICTED: uncharacterized protein LOC108369716 [Rhagoletis zephyria]